MSILLAAAVVVSGVPACTGRDLRLSTDAREGDFNGMSHAGTYLVIRNSGRRACRLPGLPTIAFRDAAGKRLAAIRQPPAGMHPGPVIAPIVLAAGDRVATGLRWVSGPVYDRNRRLEARTVDLTVGGRTLHAPVRATMFAPQGQPAHFDQPPLTPFR